MDDSAGVRIDFRDEEERALQLALEESRKEAEKAGIAVEKETEAESGTETEISK